VLKKLVVLTKLSLPLESQKLEDNASRTVLCVKGVLAARQKNEGIDEAIAVLREKLNEIREIISHFT